MSGDSPGGQNRLVASACGRAIALHTLLVLLQAEPLRALRAGGGLGRAWPRGDFPGAFPTKIRPAC